MTPQRRRTAIGGAVGAGIGLVVVVIAVVVLRPVPGSSTSGRIAVGGAWSSPYGVTFTYERWQGEPREGFHIFVEDTQGARQTVVVAPQGAELMRETYGVPWHVVSFEGMTTDGSDWIVIEALRAAPATASSPDHRR